MSTSPPSTSKWNDRRRSRGARLLPLSLALLVLCLLSSAFPSRARPGEKPDKRRGLPLFLEFFKGKEPKIVGKTVRFPSAAGEVKGYLVRQEGAEPLPAVLLLPDAAGLTEWMKTNAHDLAAIGFVVLALDSKAEDALTPARALADEVALARLSAAVRWLRRQGDVMPDRVGVFGFSGGGAQALALAASTPLQACVVCSAQVSLDADLLAPLHGTAVLGVFPAKDAPADLPAFEKALAAAHVTHFIHRPPTRAGFMLPGHANYEHDPAEHAWYEIYEFLGKYVEDADENAPAKTGTLAPLKGKGVTTIADIMRTVNDGRGVRGKLLEDTAKTPADAKQWDRVRSEAALLAEANRWLQTKTPPRGSRAHWLDEIRAFTDSADQIVAAADRKDLEQMRRGLETLATRCAGCHKKHR